MLNLEGLREAIRIRSGVPERSSSGVRRINEALGYALRYLWKDVPQVFLKAEQRMLLQEAIGTSQTVGAETTIDVNPNDARAFRLSTVDATWPVDGTLNARWIDIIDSDGNFHRRRIRETFRANTTPDWGAGGIRDCLVVDEPWINNSDTELTYRIYTYEYPLDPDIQRVAGMIRNPEEEPSELLESVHPEELEHWRRGHGWTASGNPEKWAMGDFYQERSPHDEPAASLLAEEPNDDEKWGWDTLGNEHSEDDATYPYYEDAGGFQYCYCLGWGRMSNIPKPIVQRAVDPDPTAHDLRPFYISAPSKPSNAMATTWGASAIRIVSVHQEYVQGFGTSDENKMSWNRSGLEKWWFRRRITNEGSANAKVSNVETDGIYYLWRITPASVVSIVDRGDSGPPDIRFPLKEWTGHRHVRFDRTPADCTTQVMIRAHLRPGVMAWDTDMCRVHVDALEALVTKALSYLAGERDGHVKRRNDYNEMYKDEVKELRRLYAFSGSKVTPFGDGLATNDSRSVINNYPVREG